MVHQRIKAILAEVTLQQFQNICLNLYIKPLESENKNIKFLFYTDNTTLEKKKIYLVFANDLLDICFYTLTPDGNGVKIQDDFMPIEHYLFEIWYTAKTPPNIEDNSALSSIPIKSVSQIQVEKKHFQKYTASEYYIDKQQNSNFKLIKYFSSQGKNVRHLANIQCLQHVCKMFKIFSEGRSTKEMLLLLNAEFKKLRSIQNTSQQPLSNGFPSIPKTISVTPVSQAMPAIVKQEPQFEIISSTNPPNELLENPEEVLGQQLNDPEILDVPDNIDTDNDVFELKSNAKNDDTQDFLDMNFKYWNNSIYEQDNELDTLSEYDKNKDLLRFLNFDNSIIDIDIVKNENFKTLNKYILVYKVLADKIYAFIPETILDKFKTEAKKCKDYSVTIITNDSINSSSEIDDIAINQQIPLYQPMWNNKFCFLIFKKKQNEISDVIHLKRNANVILLDSTGEEKLNIIIKLLNLVQ